MSFPIEFPKCPNCGCKDTVGRLGCAGEPSVSKDTFVSLEKKITPVQDFTKISTPTTKILMRHYDTCSKCGLDYCTRVEKTTMDTNTLMKMMGLNIQMARKQ
jgi:hypothetical protein